MVEHLCPFKNCNSKFKRPYHLQTHVQKHKGIKEFNCTKCEHSFHRQQHLQRHISETHENQRRLKKPLSCDHCGRKYNTAWGLRRHQVQIKQVQLKKIRKYRCIKCGKGFFNCDDLEKHSLKHKRFECIIPSCPWSAHKFNWKFYNKHMIVYHSDPFECENCGEKFLLKSQIRQHVEKHLPRFTCTEPGCNKTFAFLRNRNKHVRVGHGERNYKCPVIECDWKFKYKSSYDRHIKCHQQNKQLIPMAKRLHKREQSFITANKLAVLAFKT